LPQGENKDTVLFQAALAAKWREPPRDALDTMVLATSGQDLSKCDEYEQTDFMPFDARVKRTEGTLKGKDGKIFKITKGAPHVILNLCANKAQIKDQVESKVLELGKRGIRSLAVARQDNNDGNWRMLGILTFLDPPRPDTKQTIEECRKYGVAVKMITGDHTVIAVETSRVLGMGTNVKGSDGLPVLGDQGAIPDDLVEKYAEMIVPADGFAQVFPEHKYLIVETLRQAGFRCGMTGDGVNDAPALKRADVGIAVSGSTDAARAAADIVLTGEGLSVVIDAIKLSREVFGRLKNFILYRISATLQLLVFFFISVFAFRPIDLYEKSFCPFADDSKCYIGKPPVNYAKLMNGWVPGNATVFKPVYATATPRTCPKGTDPKTCYSNPKLFETSHHVYIIDGNTGRATDNHDLCPKYKMDKEEKEAHCIYSGAPWPDFFQLPVLMLMLITLLNDGTLISIG
jgi:H+-transporting ATPase